MHDGGHPVEPPRRGEPAQGAGDPVQALDQVRLVHRRGQPAPPPARVRQRPDQQARLGAPAPGRGRVRQLHPVPLGLIPGRVVDHRDRPALRGMARLAVRPQAPGPQLPGERRIRAVVPSVRHLVEQGGRPQVRVLGQPGRAVRGERPERISRRPGPDPGLPGRRAGKRGSSCGPAPGGGRSRRSSTPGGANACASMSSSRVIMSGGAPSSWRVVRDRQL